jgi:hypothetical protein
VRLRRREIHGFPPVLNSLNGPIRNSNNSIC